MARGLWLCGSCRSQVSVTAGTIFQDSKLPLTVWFRAMWQVTRPKNGMSALGLPRVLGLGSCKTAWALLHNCGGRWCDPDASDWGASWRWTRPTGAARKRVFADVGAVEKALIAVAVEAASGRSKAIGRIRLRCIPDTHRATRHTFIGQAVEPGSTVVTDGLQAYRELVGYVHDRHVQQRQPADAEHLLPRVHRVASLLKRWRLGAHQGAIAHEHLDDDLDEFTFRFNHRTSASRGKLFYCLAQQAVHVDSAPFNSLVTPKR